MKRLLCFLLSLLIFSSFVTSQESENKEEPATQHQDDATVSEDAAANAQGNAANDPTTKDLVSGDEKPNDGTLDGFPAPHENTAAILFIKNPSIGSLVKSTEKNAYPDIPANKPLNMLISFTNNDAEKVFVIDYVTGGLRYPQDYSYYVSNFTAIRPQGGNRVEPKHEISLEYALPDGYLSTLAHRPFGLAMRVGYHDVEDNKPYVLHAFNDTIMFTEWDESGMVATELLFLYVILGGGSILAIFALYHYVSNSKLGRNLKRKSGASSGNTSQASSNHNQSSGDSRSTKSAVAGTVDSESDADFAKVDSDKLQWIPQEHLKLASKKSPVTAPRKRA